MIKREDYKHESHYLNAIAASEIFANEFKLEFLTAKVESYRKNKIYDHALREKLTYTNTLNQFKLLIDSNKVDKLADFNPNLIEEYVNNKSNFDSIYFDFIMNLSNEHLTYFANALIMDLRWI